MTSRAAVTRGLAFSIIAVAASACRNTWTIAHDRFGFCTTAGGMDYHVTLRQRNPNAHPFLFATGIENSYPTILGRDGRTVRVDEMAKTGHYEHWQQDVRLVRELGLDYLRYGPPYHLTSLGSDRFDWSFADQSFDEIRRLAITPITDLCHFGTASTERFGRWARHTAGSFRSGATSCRWRVWVWTSRARLPTGARQLLTTDD